MKVTTKSKNIQRRKKVAVFNSVGARERERERERERRRKNEELRAPIKRLDLLGKEILSFPFLN